MIHGAVRKCIHVARSTAHVALSPASIRSMCAFLVLTNLNTCQRMLQLPPRRHSAFAGSGRKRARGTDEGKESAANGGGGMKRKNRLHMIAHTHTLPLSQSPLLRDEICQQLWLMVGMQGLLKSLDWGYATQRCPKLT